MTATRPTASPPRWAGSSTSPAPASASPSAVVEAVLSVERGPLDAQGDFHRLMTSWIDAALGDDEVRRP